MQDHVLLWQYLLCSYKDGIRTDYVNKQYNGNCNPPLGIEETERLKNAINISPNPAENNIQFHISENIRIAQTDVYDLQGRKRVAPQNGNNIDVSSLNSGCYFLQFTTTENIKINKIFIKH